MPSALKETYLFNLNLISLIIFQRIYTLRTILLVSLYVNNNLTFIVKLYFSVTENNLYILFHCLLTIPNCPEFRSTSFFNLFLDQLIFLCVYSFLVQHVVWFENTTFIVWLNYNFLQTQYFLVHGIWLWLLFDYCYYYEVYFVSSQKHISVLIYT